jgi:hypothetical protein
MPADAATSGGPGAVRRALRWAFLNRRTGRVTLAQWPNVPLIAFVALSVARRVVHPVGRAETVLRVLAGVAISVWALDEIVRGVNPFRRALGVVVLSATLGGAALCAR